MIKEFLEESAKILDMTAESSECCQAIKDAADAIIEAYKNGGKVLLVGNGGSAADAQHIAGEFVSRLNFDRAPLPALALTVDSSVMTAISNDYGYEKVFERQVLGLGNSGDVLIAISTSGKSPSIIKSIEAARSKSIFTIGFTGLSGGSLPSLVDVCLKVPSNRTPLIQQVHITAAHIICGIVEKEIFAN